MRFQKLGAIFCAGLAMAASVAAADSRPSIAIHGAADYVIADTDGSNGNGFSASIAFWPAAPSYLEATVFRHAFPGSAGPDVWDLGAQLSLMHPFTKIGSVDLLGTGGLGMTRSKARSLRDDNPFVHLGVVAKLPLANGPWALRADAGYRHTFAKGSLLYASSLDDFVLRFGLSWSGWGFNPGSAGFNGDKR